MVGIYKIENKINGHKYIGQSIDIYRRWREEKRVAFDPIAKGYDYYLSRAFRKYGLDNFTFEIIEECSKDKLNERERYWIQYYNSYFNGYNLTLGGDGSGSAEQKESTIGIINDLKTTNLYHREIAEKWNVSVEMVQGINTGRYWHSEYEDYPLQKEHKFRTQVEKYYCIDCGKEISKGAKRCQDCYMKTTRTVSRPTKDELYNLLISLNGNFTQVGRQYGVTDNAIRKWCDAYDIPRNSKDYKTQNKNIELTTMEHGKTLPRAIAQVNKQTNEVIQTYSSIEAAAKAINKPGGGNHIGDVCRGKRKTAYGFIWKFI